MPDADARIEPSRCQLDGPDHPVRPGPALVDRDRAHQGSQIIDSLGQVGPAGGIAIREQGQQRMRGRHRRQRRSPGHAGRMAEEQDGGEADPPGRPGAVGLAVPGRGMGRLEGVLARVRPASEPGPTLPGQRGGEDGLPAASGAAQEDAAPLAREKRSAQRHRPRPRLGAHAHDRARPGGTHELRMPGQGLRRGVSLRPRHQVEVSGRVHAADQHGALTRARQPAGGRTHVANGEADPTIGRAVRRRAVDEARVMEGHLPRSERDRHRVGVVHAEGDFPPPGQQAVGHMLHRVLQLPLAVRSRG